MMYMIDPVITLMSWVESQPSHPAVVTSDKTTTYGDFGKQVQKIAGTINRLHDHPRVLIYLDQDANAYASMFGVMMAGGIYSPVYTGIPPLRLQEILASFSPHVILTKSSKLSKIKNFIKDFYVLCVDTLPEYSLSSCNAYDEAAYVIYTSGSTGKPKGVVISPSSIAHFLGWSIPALAMTPDDRCSQHPNIAFDLSVIDIYSTLCSGATLVPVIGTKYRMMPAQIIKDYQLTRWISVPSVVDLMHKANQVNHDYLMSLEKIYFCGEPLLRHHLEIIFQALPEVTVVNSYGPTEATVSCTEVYLTSKNYLDYCSSSSVTIGSPIPGMNIKLEGQDNCDLSEGEIVISGPQVANGYWQDHHRTKLAFSGTVSNGQDRSYRTGDWAKYDDKGNLYFCHRMDQQVKIQGYRLELGDVDAALRRSGAINARTLYLNGQLISFVEWEGYYQYQVMIRRLQKFLPKYAIPKIIHRLETLPRNTNDKVDLLALEKIARNEQS